MISILLLSVIVLCFSACAKKMNVLSYTIENDSIVISGYSDKSTVSEITVPDEIDGFPVTKIANFGISNAESLKKITIGKNVREIESWSMTNNQHLIEFVVDPENDYFTAVDGILFSKDMKTLYYYPCGKNVEYDKYGQAITKEATRYSIPDGVETIASKAFYKCYFVDIDYMPNSVTRIEEKAFHRCSQLTDFTLSSSLAYIGKDAFSYDELLTEITIPQTIREIGEYAFFNCTGMQKIIIHTAEENISLGKKWQPTAKGKIRDDCEIIFNA